MRRLDESNMPTERPITSKSEIDGWSAAELAQNSYLNTSTSTDLSGPLDLSSQQLMGTNKIPLFDCLTIRVVEYRRKGNKTHTRTPRLKVTRNGVSGQRLSQPGRDLPRKMKKEKNQNPKTASGEKT